MKEVGDYVRSKLAYHCINLNVEKEVNALFFEKKINDKMPLDLAYRVFLQSESHPVYKNLLEDRRPFDIRLLARMCRRSLSDVRKKVEEMAECEYCFVSDGFVGIKLRSPGRSAESGIFPQISILQMIYGRIVPYISLEEVQSKDVVFDIGSSYEAQKYTELVESLRTVNLPIHIIDDEFVNGCGVEGPCEYNECNLELEDREWPKSRDAVQCAKTAFYCFLYRRSPHRFLLERKFLVLKYKGSMFLVRINEPKSPLTLFREKVRAKNETWKQNVRMIKRFLGYHGFYPVYYNDYLVEFMCFHIHEWFSASFFAEFVSRRHNLNCCFSLETFITEDSDGFVLKCEGRTLRLPVPETAVQRRFGALCSYFRKGTFKLFDVSLNLHTEKLLIPNIRDYDFALCKVRKTGFRRVRRKPRNVVVSLEVERLKHLGYFFYSVPLKLLMVKCKPGISPALLCNVTLVKTHFEYVRINCGHQLAATVSPDCPRQQEGKVK